MTAPTLTINDDGLLVAEWADGAVPDEFTITTIVFRQLLGEANLSRLRARALTELHTSLGKMIDRSVLDEIPQ